MQICVSFYTCHKIEQCLRRGYEWACERLYHELAWQYDLVSRVVSLGCWDAWRKVALSELEAHKKPTDLPMLEIGFGTGDLLLAARRLGMPVIGLEFSSQMHAVASTKALKEKLEAPRVQATAKAMPFADGCFGALFATFPASFLLEATTLGECARILDREGVLVVVGLWVTPILAGRRINLPLLYAAPSSSLTAAWMEAFASAGFAVDLRPSMVAGAEVGVLVAKKKSNDSQKI
ncbi:MAG: methyltransferase domain-containing protein [Caldilinea sp.]|nr:methyltransferase domain-containing protein [Caldilinea sp.]MDW8442398.1 methyltransferase domain-containing protein [Caldilineaceae bacterium]